MSLIKALIFDFDGLILDTESPVFDVWQAIYREYGQELDPEIWGQIVGGWGKSEFDPAEHLAVLTREAVDVEKLRTRHQAESDALTLDQFILPGVMDYIEEAHRLGIRLAIASSSPHSWVDVHLDRLGLTDRFDVILCADDVPPGRTKPNPDLFLKALSVLDVDAGEAIVLEDSPNGVQAAQTAGIFVVVVPNPITAMLNVNAADLMLNALTDLPLVDLLARLDVK